MIDNSVNVIDNSYNEKKYNEMKELVKNRYGILLSETYTGANDKVKVRCYCAFEWEITWNQMKNGHWCPRCAGNKK